MHSFTVLGRAWTLTGSSTTGTAVEEVIFHLRNNDTRTVWIHGAFLSVDRAGTALVASGRTFSAGGAAVSPVPLDVGNAGTVTTVANLGGNLTLAGTATVMINHRINANEAVNLLNGFIVRLDQNDTIEIRVNVGAAAAPFTLTAYLHTLT